MKYLMEFSHNGALAIGIIACFLAQFIKIFTEKKKELI